ADEEEMIDEAELLSDDIIPRFEDAIEGNGGFIGLESALDNFTSNPSPGNLSSLEDSLGEVQQSVTELDDSLKNISGNPLSANLGLNFALAIPSKKFAAALSVGGSAGVSGRVKYSQADSDLFTSYVPEVQELVTFVEAVDAAVDALDPSMLPDVPTSTIIDYSQFDPNDAANTVDTIRLSDAASDPDLTSSVQVVAYAIADVGISFAREFDIKGEKVAFGITPNCRKFPPSIMSMKWMV